jgi:hypothetical protein
LASVDLPDTVVEKPIGGRSAHPSLRTVIAARDARSKHGRGRIQIVDLLVNPGTAPNDGPAFPRIAGEAPADEGQDRRSKRSE